MRKMEPTVRGPRPRRASNPRMDATCAYAHVLNQPSCQAMTKGVRTFHVRINGYQSKLLKYSSVPIIQLIKT